MTQAQSKRPSNKTFINDYQVQGEVSIVNFNQSTLNLLIDPLLNELLLPVTRKSRCSSIVIEINFWEIEATHDFFRKTFPASPKCVKIPAEICEQIFNGATRKVRNVQSSNDKKFVCERVLNVDKRTPINQNTQPQPCLQMSSLSLHQRL